MQGGHAFDGKQTFAIASRPLPTIASLLRGVDFLEPVNQLSRRERARFVVCEVNLAVVRAVRGPQLIVMPPKRVGAARGVGDCAARRGIRPDAVMALGYAPRRDAPPDVGAAF